MQIVVAAVVVSNPENGETVALAESDGQAAMAMARCRKDDHFNAKIGAGIALGRALEQLGREQVELWSSRAKTKDEVIAQRRGLTLQELATERAAQAGIDAGYAEHIEEMRQRPKEKRQLPSDEEILTALGQLGEVVLIEDTVTEAFVEFELPG